MRIYTQINGLESIKLGIPAGCDIIWQKPNIARVEISRETVGKVVFKYPSMAPKATIFQYCIVEL